MKVRLVCYEDVNGWILGKIARRLCEHLQLLNVRSDVAETPDPTADINHHIIYSQYDGEKTTCDTVMITHIDMEWKRKKLKHQLIMAEMGICMSADTVQRLASVGLSRVKLCYVNPPHDGVMRPRKIIIGITSKVQPTGCKREFMLVQLADRIVLNDYVFKIMGSQWEPVVNQLTQKGIEVEYYKEFDYDKYAQLIRSLDYYLYLGQDEGSMGFLDALAAGVPTIVTPQGFHLDAPGGITHAFNEVDELKEIFGKISENRNRLIRAVNCWTWPEYARKHLLIWKYLLDRNGGSVYPECFPETLTPELEKLGVVVTMAPPRSYKQLLKRRLQDLAWRYLFP